MQHQCTITLHSSRHKHLSACESQPCHLYGLLVRTNVTVWLRRCKRRCVPLIAVTTAFCANSAVGAQKPWSLTDMDRRCLLWCTTHTSDSQSSCWYGIGNGSLCGQVLQWCAEYGLRDKIRSTVSHPVLLTCRQRQPLTALSTTVFLQASAGATNSGCTRLGCAPSMPRRRL